VKWNSKRFYVCDKNIFGVVIKREKPCRMGKIILNVTYHIMKKFRAQFIISLKVFKDAIKGLITRKKMLVVAINKTKRKGNREEEEST
jgi:hypothetical protein